SASPAASCSPTYVRTGRVDRAGVFRYCGWSDLLPPRSPHMKKLIVPLALLLLAGPAPAQERIPDEEARNIARELIEAAKKVKAPVAPQVDADKPYGKHKDEYGAMVLPDKNLSAERLAKAGKDEIVPIGQFWMRNLAPVVDDKVI